MANETTGGAAVPEVTPAEMQAMRERGEDVLYLDVREPNEWNLFRIPGAVHLPLARVAGEVQGVAPPAKRVVVYCARGQRAELAVKAMRAVGYTGAVSLAGGIMAWIDAGGDVEE